MKLYDADLSGNAYKIRLMLALNGIEHERVAVNLAAGEARTEAFLALNPRGQVPVLVDGENTLWDSQALLAYLARKYAPRWMPVEPEALAPVMSWLAFSENECLFGMARARAVKVFARKWNYQECQDYSRQGLQFLEQHLAGNEWLANGKPSIADIAVYPYVALIPVADIALEDYPATCRWIARIQALPGYVGMDGIDARG